jgi:hypothetical protein
MGFASQGSGRNGTHPFLVSVSPVEDRGAEKAYAALLPPASSRPGGDAQWQHVYDGPGASARTRPSALPPRHVEKEKEAVPTLTEHRLRDGKVGVFQINGVTGWPAEAAYPASMQQQVSGR